MIREFLNRLFSDRKGRIGRCRVKMSTCEYIYLDENTVEAFEKFIGPLYDYDARDCCMYVWKDEAPGYWTWPICIPYGMYVVKIMNGLDVTLKAYEPNEFSLLYERL